MPKLSSVLVSLISINEHTWFLNYVLVVAISVHWKGVRIKTVAITVVIIPAFGFALYGFIMVKYDNFDVRNIKDQDIKDLNFITP